jgi:hypothetical protein
MLSAQPLLIRKRKIRERDRAPKSAKRGGEEVPKRSEAIAA